MEDHWRNTAENPQSPAERAAGSADCTGDYRAGQTTDRANAGAELGG